MAITHRSAEDEIAVVRRIPEEIMTAGNAAAIEEVFAAEFVEHNPTLGEIHGPDGFRDRVYAPLRGGFSDLEITAEDLIADGDRVVLRATIRGTHDGEFNGIEATGNTIDIPAIAVHRLADGQVAERWVTFDALGMMQQLGVVPMPDEAPDESSEREDSP